MSMTNRREPATLGPPREPQPHHQHHRPDTGHQPCSL